MNKTMQNRFGGVPSAHNGNTKTRFFRKPIAALLMLLVMLGGVGRAWGQTVYWYLNGAPIYDNYLTRAAVNWTGATITIANGATVYIDGQITITSGIITIEPETGGTCTIKRGTSHAGWMLVTNPNCGLVINDGVTIDGRSASTSSGYHSELVVHAGAACILNGVTMTNNYSYDCGAAVNNVGALTCNNCIFSGLVAEWGGALYNNDGAGMTLNNCTFSNNHAGRGGAVTNYGNLTITGGSFSGNYCTSANGGAIENSKRTSNGVLNVTGTTFSSNYAQVNGGAIFNDSNQPSLSTALTSCTFTGNHAQVGGAIFNSTTMDIVGTAASNTTFGDGTDGNKNYAWQGGAIYSNGTSLNLSYCTFDVNKTINSSNHGGEGGGAVFNRQGTATCRHCTFTGNLAYRDNQNNSNAHGLGFGGAILNRGTLSCSDNCTFTNNTAYVGGGICSFEKVTVTNCTFTSNTASGPGGGNGGGFYQANESTSNPSVVTS